MKQVIVLFMSILILSSCTFSSDGYFVRWWNGNLPIESSMSIEDIKIMDYCYTKTKHLPRNNTEEREKSFAEYLICEKNMKEQYIKKGSTVDERNY